MRLLSELATFIRRTKVYWWTVTIAGFTTLALALPQLFQLKRIDWMHLFGLAVVVILTGRYPVRIPGTQCVITSSDIFIF